MVLGSLIIIILCLKSVQVREIFSFHDRKDVDHELEDDVSGNSALYAYDVDHERDHLNIHVFINVEARNALSDPESLWANDTIPYKLSDKYDSEEKATILEAMTEFKNKTCIRFEPRKKEETPFILIEPGSGCSATVGRSEKGRVSLGEGCNNKGIIIHELMHILGFLHEHNRPDRDDYVEVNWDNIDKKYKSNFEKKSADDVQDGNITYDYNSIMHYGSYSFAKNKSIPTIITLKENATIGQRDGFSENDIEKILERYACKKGADDTVSRLTILPLMRLHRSHATTQNTPTPSSATKKGILSKVKKILGARTTSKSTATTRKIKAKATTVKQMTQPKDNVKSLRSMLATAIFKLVAENRNITLNSSLISEISTPSPATMVNTSTSHTKLTNLSSGSSLMTLILETVAKLAGADQKMKPSLTAFQIPSAQQDGSDFNRRQKRNVRYPTYISSEDDEEYEKPQVVESVKVEVEAPMVTERKTVVNKELVSGDQRVYPGNFNEQFEEWRRRYSIWMDYYDKWVQHRERTQELLAEKSLAENVNLSQKSSDITSPTEVRDTPTILPPETQIIENDGLETIDLRKGSLIAPNPVIDHFRQMTPENCGHKTTNEPCENTSICGKIIGASTESFETNAPCITTSNCERKSTLPATDIPLTSTSNCANSVTDTLPVSTTTDNDSLCLTTSMSTAGCISSGTSKIGEITSQNVVSEGSTSSISLQPEISGKTTSKRSSSVDIDTSMLGSTTEISKSSIDFVTETTHSDTKDVEITTQDRANRETNSLLRTTLLRGVSTTADSRTSGRSSVIINSTPMISTRDTVNTDKMDVELTTLAETSSETKNLQGSTSGRGISRSKDPGTNLPGSTKAITNTLSLSTREIASSDSMDLELTKTESTTSKSKLPQRTTLMKEVFTSEDPGRLSSRISTLFELSTTGENSESTNQKIGCPTEEIETGISTSAPFSKTTSGCQENILRTSTGTTNESETSDVNAELTTPGSTNINTQSLERSTLGSKISTNRDIGITSPRSTTEINTTPIGTKVETANSDAMALELTTPSRKSPNRLQRTTLEKDISTSKDPGSSTISISSESTNSQSTIEDVEREKDDLDTIVTTATATATTSENLNTISNTPAGTSIESVTSEIMDVEVTAQGSTSTKAKSLERTTLENAISTTRSTVITSRRSTPTTITTPKSTATETANSNEMAREISTRSSNRPERTTLESGSLKNELRSSTPIISTSLGISSESVSSQSTTEDFECDDEDDDLEISTTTTNSITTTESPNTPTGTASKSVTSNIMDDGVTTQVSASTKAKSLARTTLEREISTSGDTGITSKSTTTMNNNPASTIAETSNSDEMALEVSAPSRSPQRTTSKRDISMSSDLTRSTPTISTSSKISSEAGISQSISEDDDSEKTILTITESSNTIISTATDIVSESRSSDAVVTDLTTSGSFSTKTTLPEGTSLEREFSTSTDVSITSKSTITINNIPSDITEETLTNDATDDTSQITTIESGISISSDSSSKISSTSGISSETGDLEQVLSTRITSSATDAESTSTLVLTTSESLISNALDPALTIGNSFSPQTETPGEKTSVNLFSTSISPCVTTPTAKDCQRDPVTENHSTKNDVSESVDTTVTSDCMDSKTDSTGTTTPRQGSSEALDLQVTSSRIITTIRATTEQMIPDVTTSKCGTSQKDLKKDLFSMRHFETRAMQAKKPGRKSLEDKNSEDSEEGSTNIMTVSDNIETDSTVDQESDLTDQTESDSTVITNTSPDTETSTLPFEFAVQPGEHSIPYHKIRMYRSLQGRTALSNPNRIWPDGIVPYEFSDKYDDTQKGFILEGMKEMENKTCVRFMKRNNETSHVFIEPEDKCKAGVGRQPGMSKLTLSDGCYMKGTILHELMHVLSFVHEQNRPDRDSFVLVVWDNIIEDAKPNFRRHTEQQVTTFDVGYDYFSLMHYSGNEFAKDPERPTLVPLQSGVKLGDKEDFSEKDLLKINTLYDCPKKRADSKEKGDGKEKDDKKDVSSDAQALLQKLLKYFEMNFQRLFRSILRTIQKFRPIILNKSKDD